MERHLELKGRGLLLLSLLWFLWFNNIYSRAVFSPILPLLEDEFLVSHARASGIFMFQSVGYGISLLLTGLYAGRLGYKKSIALSLAVTSAAFFLIPLVKTFSALYFFSLIIGFSAGSYIPSVIPLITEYFAEKNWGKSIVIHDSAASVSIFCTPFLALLFIHYFGWRGIFVTFAIIFLLAATTFWLTVDELKITQARKNLHSDLFRKRALWIMGAIWVCATGATWSVYFTVPLYLTKELGLTIEYANSLFGLSRLGGIGVVIACGFLVDRVSVKKMIFTLLLLSGVLTVLVGTSSARFIGVVLSLQVIFIMGFYPLGLTAIARTFDREERGMATGIIMTVSMSTGSGLITYLLGLSGDLISFRFGYVALGALVILGSSLLFSLKELK
ncbi:MAG: transporter [Deltaproteobacteria bacterium]|jgi:MFS family permease|nr:transporter [Deltaproteobacteria bacterium]